MATRKKASSKKAARTSPVVEDEDPLAMPPDNPEGERVIDPRMTLKLEADRELEYLLNLSNEEKKNDHRFGEVHEAGRGIRYVLLEDPTET